MESGASGSGGGARAGVSPDALRPLIERIVRDVLDERAENASPLACPAVRDRVWVRRDSRSVPHIEARTEWDLYCAQGFVTASDRLWQMELLRRTVRGEVAEILGAPALEQDKYFRRYGFGAVAEVVALRLTGPIREAFEAYAAGVNAWIERCRQTQFPLEFRLLGFTPAPWTPADSIVVGKLFSEALSTGWPNDIIRAMFMDVPAEQREDLFREASPLDAIVVGTDDVDRRGPAALLQVAADPEAEAATAVDRRLLPRLVESKRTRAAALRLVGCYAPARTMSNNWVVDGRHSASGQPILATDPHLAASAPSIWYLTHLKTSSVDVAGSTSPGIPGILLGHNKTIAWGTTNVGADIQDVYRETFDPVAVNWYRTPIGWQEAEVRRETIRVRNEDGATEVVPFDVRVTRNGPLVLERGGEAYALRWSSLDATLDELAAFYWLNRASNWAEFREALRTYVGPPQNFIYADTSGNIGYSCAGSVPARRRRDVGLPHEGSRRRGGWRGYLPFDELPQAHNPSSGVIVTANNRIVGRDYPHTLTHDWSAPYRARRIHDCLALRPSSGIDDCLTIQADTYSYADAIFTREVVAIAREHAGAAPEWQAIIDRFDGWDARSHAQSREMPLAVAMRTAFARRILAAALGEDRAESYTRWPSSSSFIDFLVEHRPAAWLPKDIASYPDLVLTAYRDARQDLTALVGPDETNWVWGRVGAPIVFVHPLAGLPGIGAPFAIPSLPQHTGGGGGTTVNAGAFVSMRFVVDLSDWDSTRQGIALGQSGDPSSPHWNDQHQEWQRVAPGKFPFSDAAVRADAREVLVLVPA